MKKLGVRTEKSLVEELKHKRETLVGQRALLKIAHAKKFQRSRRQETSLAWS